VAELNFDLQALESHSLRDAGNGLIVPKAFVGTSDLLASSRDYRNKARCLD